LRLSQSLNIYHFHLFTSWLLYHIFIYRPWDKIMR
jgi:hypothetical protein